MADQRVRIQPRGLCIPEEAPFRHDRLGRKESAEVLTRIVSRIEGPCVVALDAPWGYGKTTFLNMWTRWLRNEGFPVVAFNAWETDFTNHPLLALSSELTKELESFTKTAPVPGFNTLKSAAIKLLRVAIPAIPQLAGSLLPGGGVAVEAVLAVLSKAVSDEADTNDYQEVKEAIASFKEALGNLAKRLEKPLILMIDELDRCRPSYAVELLEVAKHFFAVDNVVFVLAVNRAELAHSVRALYGSGFDAEGYLRRFFDLDFQLPKPSREQFVRDLLETTRLNSILANVEPQAELPAAKALLEAFLGSPELSMRQVQQAAHRLGLVWALLPTDDALLDITAVIVIVLRTADFAVYQHFIGGTATDEEVANVVFRFPETASLRRGSHGMLIERHIILGLISMKADYGDFERGFSGLNSPLLHQYRELTGTTDNTEHARNLLEYMQTYWQENHYALGAARLRQAFFVSIGRLELLSPE